MMPIQIRMDGEKHRKTWLQSKNVRNLYSQYKILLRTKRIKGFVTRFQLLFKISFLIHRTIMSFLSNRTAYSRVSQVQICC
jgi:hypothetical protein